MASKMSALQGEAHFFEESMNPMKVKEYLSRPKVTALCNKSDSRKRAEAAQRQQQMAKCFDYFLYDQLPHYVPSSFPSRVSLLCSKLEFSLKGFSFVPQMRGIRDTKNFLPALVGSRLTSSAVLYCCRRLQEVDKLKGMKWLLAMVSKGRDVSEFFSDVVKNMAVRSVEVKKMVYIYLVHYADNDAQCRELALLSINSFQNDLRGSNQVRMFVCVRV